ncbi:MAG: RNA polymerase sigma-54 factor, partial [Rhodospirillales bacterium]|nr:RNA polymerase sigma-54 factor [Rhodospirillales bacterium]
MALSPRLDLRQAQTLVMTPQLQQAIKLLQLSNLELTSYVETELEQNPLLERDDQGRADDMEAVQLHDERPVEVAVLDAVPGQTDEAPLDLDYDNLWDGDSPGDAVGDDSAFADWGRSGGRHDFEDGEGGIEQTVARELTLRDHLLQQLNVDITDPAERMIGLHLVEMVDACGWLTGDLAELAELLGCDVDQVQAVLAKLQRFDPPGIFARTLAECLGLQLRDQNRCDPAMQTLLNHLDL